jgi:hypothetical protein
LRKVFLAIPAYTGEVHAGTCASIVQSAYELAPGNALVDLQIQAGDSLITFARNLLLARFLASDCTDLVFVDADISWEAGALLRLLSHPVDFVAGAYRFKRDDEDYPIAWLEKDELWADPETGLLEVSRVPFGFVRLTRAACYRMTAVAADKPFRHRSAPEIQCHAIFDLEYRDGTYIGEDFVFCDRWRAQGGKVWLDPELAITHHGGKAYPGHIGNWLKGR